MPNKSMLIGLSLAMAISLSACTKSNATKPTTPQENQQQTKPATSEAVTTAGGIGDTTEYFKEKYGENTSKQQNAGSYQNNSIQVMFNDNRATSIQFNFDQTSKPRKTLEESQALTSSVIPADAKKIRDFKDDKTGETGAVYESATLAKVFEKNYKEAEDVAKKIGTHAPKAGTFSVKVRQDQRGISGVVIGLGEA